MCLDRLENGPSIVVDKLINEILNIVIIVLL